MTLNIAPGQVAVPSPNNTGTTLCSSDATEQVTLAAAPASGSNRYDLIVCQPRGNDLDGGTNNDFIFAATTGTAAASPTPPAIPSGSAVLAQVYVAGGSASIVAGNIQDLRPGALSVPIPYAPPLDVTKLPTGRLAYVQRTTQSASVAAESIILTTPSITVPANRNIRVVAYLRNAICNDGAVQMRIREGTTVGGNQLIDFVINMITAGVQINSGAGGMFAYSYPSPPSSGARQWVLTSASIGSNGASVTAAANTPCWMAVFDDGGI
jgi:hypothetical protein